jgi:hypothetical protein
MIKFPDCYNPGSNQIMNPISPTESEWLTRKTLIDPKLKAAGWQIVPFEAGKPLSSYDRCAIEEYGVTSRAASESHRSTILRSR